MFFIPLSIPIVCISLRIFRSTSISGNLTRVITEILQCLLSMSASALMHSPMYFPNDWGMGN
jgi:hypothetical protein